MGFFSSRKAEPTPLPAKSEQSSANVIRSRFYGKKKTTSGRSSLTPSSLPVPREASVVNQSPSVLGRQVSADALTMSLAERLNDLAVANADGLLDDEEYRLLRQNLFERFATGSSSPTDPTALPRPSPNAGPRDPQHHQITRAPSVHSQRSIATSVSSFFRRATGRSSSLASPALSASGSVGGSVFSFQQQMSPVADTSSVYSRLSSTGAPRSGYPRSIARQPSNDSLMSTSQAGSASGSVTSDLRGMMTRQRMLGSGTLHYASSISSRATTRSAKPPSAFHLRQLPTSPPRLQPRTHEEDEDEDNPKSAKELRAEIENVESEGRKLLDAFNGLELTALTKSRTVGPVTSPSDVNFSTHRLSIYSETVSSSTLGSSYTLIPDRAASMRKNAHGQVHTLPLVSQPVNIKRKPSVVNSIAGSLKSKSSASDLRSGFLSSAAPSLHNSRSSPNLLSSMPPPPAPAIPVSASNPAAIPVKKRPSIMRSQRQATYPTIALSSGPHTASPVSVPRPSPLSKRTNVPAPDSALQALEAELTDIRRRKADVSTRYERRLEFLRAKLKSAEIRERLSRR